MIEKTNRRDFIKSALSVSLAAGININNASANAEPNNLPALDNNQNKNFLQADVLVVGAGSSGVPAALAAARNGAKVILLEEDPIPGGAPVNMFVSSPCGGPIVGIYKEIVDELQAKHNFSLNPSHASWFLPSSWARVIADKISKEPNITLLTNVKIANVLINKKKQQIDGVVINRGGEAKQEIRANIVIDATGDADVADMAGCKSMFGRESRSQFNEPIGPEKADDKIQDCTWMFITQKLRPNAVMDLSKIRWIPNESGYGWIKKKDPQEVKEFLKRNAGIYLQWGGHIKCKDTRDPIELGKAQADAFKDIIERDAPQLMEFGYGMMLAPKLGVRVSRRIIGDYVLAVNDLIKPNWPEDVVSVGKYGIDAWGDKDAKDIKMPKNGYGIPYKCLLAKGIENLFVVGRSISATHFAQSSIRVQPIVSQMGQAAGTAAALATKNKVKIRSINIKDLQQSLKSQGMLEKANA